MNTTRAILPSAEIAHAIAELLVECDIPEVPHYTLCDVVLRAATSISKNNFYEPYDTIDNYLSALSQEYSSVTMAGIALSDVINLNSELVSLANRLNNTMLRIGLSSLNTDPIFWQTQ